MDAFLYIFGLMFLTMPFVIVYLLISHRGVKRSLREVQGRLASLQSRLDPQGEAPVSREAPEPEPAAAEIAGPWKAPASPAPIPPEPAGDATPQPEPAGPPRFVVMRADRFRKLGTWLAGNWFYAVSAVSLALAGIFLVQYGAENGLLPPRIRVLAALALGAALIATGEFVRRRHGDDEGASTAYLPSVFSGAGIVTLFGGILAARILYALTGPEVAMAGMVAVALTALVLGWFHGPLLAAVGIIGAFCAPFMVGGSSQDVSWLYGYFLVIAALGLGIDTIRRWAWVTVLTLVLGYAAATLLAIGSGVTAGVFALFLTAMAILAILVPVRRLSPDHDGTMIVEMAIRTPGMPWPEFPTRVAFAAMLTTSALLVPVSEAEFWLAITLLAILSALGIVWSRRAAALQDAALIPVVGFLGALTWQGFDRMEVWRAFRATHADNPEADFPLEASVLLAMAAVISGLALWRALCSTGSRERFGLIWAGAAALSAPVAAICLEIAWAPGDVIGAYPWALHAAAVAGLMVVCAERLARADGPEDRLRASLPVLSALSALAFAFTILFAETALTLAFVVTIVAAAALDRMYRMPPMTVFITVGIATIGYRLVVDPGLDFATRGPLVEVIAVYGGALAGLVAAQILLTPLHRPKIRLALDSAAWSVAGLLLSVLLFRWLHMLAGRQEASHWARGLHATIWLGLMVAQLRRLSAGGPFRYAHIALALVFGLTGFTAVFAALTLANPLLGDWLGMVVGPPLINSLAVAYLLPALLLGAAALRIHALNRWVRVGFATTAIALAVFWLFMMIRHAWQGAEGMVLDHGVSQPELYSYTIVLLLAGAGLFYQSLARTSNVMRRAGLAVIGLAVAKVFLVDASGLTGLTRVFSFLILGLALAGLAWLGRWAERSAVTGGPGKTDESG
ncbi:MAG: DUF2339 domain-containing protein [Tropicimonas sp.]|uniref:DUF2339 domain-containing protein n=1 Tax=Tropicimonas sp. TaxID=2067044 RepID=UPI003A852B79